MDWHARYSQQANWTRDLRAYLFKTAGIDSAQRILEVGCGTGAVLSGLQTPAMLHGLDLDPAVLIEARIHVPSTRLTHGDALHLPYPGGSFDITYCHFLLLWVPDPLRALQEMHRVTRPGGSILALAEPDYSARVDQPDMLSVLGRWQTESLRKQGADPSLGRRLADLFFRAGLHIVETGAIQRQRDDAQTPEERELEWEVLETDLVGIIPVEEVQRLKLIDMQAWESGERILHIPTYFAWGKAQGGKRQYNALRKKTGGS